MKTIKQIITVVAVAIFMLSFFNANAQKEQEKNFEESVAILIQDRLPIKSLKESARVVKLVSFKKDYKLPQMFKFNDVELRDDGKGYDKIAGDGVYTSITLYPNLKSISKHGILTFDNFKYSNSSAFINLLNKASSSGHIECHVAWVFGYPLVYCNIVFNW